MADIRFWKNWAITTRIGVVISFGVISGTLVMVIGAVIFLKKEYLTTFGNQQSATVQATALSLDADLSSKLKALMVVAAAMPRNPCWTPLPPGNSSPTESDFSRCLTMLGNHKLIQ